MLRGAESAKLLNFAAKFYHFGSPMKSAEIVMPATLVAYFLLLIYISRRVSRKSAGGGNDDFFRAGHSSPWWMVAVGMVGALSLIHI